MFLLWLDPHLDSPLKFLNHSCNPNVKRGRDGVTFLALREIGIDEEPYGEGMLEVSFFVPPSIDLFANSLAKSLLGSNIF